MSFPLLSIGIAFLLIYFARVFVLVGQIKRPEGFDNRHPRDQQTKLEGWARRANAAHANAFESFAPYAAGILVSLTAGVPETVLSVVAALYLTARFTYTLAYIADVHKLRTPVWFVGFFSTIVLLFLPLFH